VGLLDELEQEAQRRKLSADDAVKRKVDREEIFRTQIDPGLTALHEYLQKLTTSLKVLKPKKQLRYALAGYGDLVGYVEHEYDLHMTNQNSVKEIKLHFPCVIASDECPAVEIQGGSKVKTVASAFQRYHLGGMVDPRKDGGEVVAARFNAKGRITLLATFVGDAETAVVKSTFTNFESLASVTKTFTGAQLNETLFDEIGRFLTREPNNLMHEALPDSYRMQLRSKVQQDQIKRRWETKISEQQQSELAQIKRQQSITGRFAALVVKDKAATPETGGPGGWLGRLKGLVKKGS